MATPVLHGTYEAVLLERVGGPDALRVTALPTPEPGPREVVVRVLAAGVAFAQVLMRRGVYAYAPPFPFTPGAEVVGDIVAIGSEVTGWMEGDRVAAFSGVGGYAELAAIPADALVRIPQGLDPAAVAALPMNYVTAWQLLHRAARVKAGETVLVHGAGGGVGTAVLELARLAGVTVVGSDAPDKLPLVLALGAYPVDYTRGSVVEQVHALVGPVDVVLDPLGGEHVVESARALRPGGRLVVYGFAAPGAETPEAALVLRERMALWNAEPDGIRAVGYSLGAIAREAPRVIRDDLDLLVGLLANERIRPVIARRLPFREAARAHEMLERGQVSGKLVLVPE